MFFPKPAILNGYEEHTGETEAEVKSSILYRVIPRK